MSDGPTTLSVITPIGRTSFMHVFRPADKFGGNGKEYSLTLLFPKSFVNEGKFKPLEDAYATVTRNALSPKLCKVVRKLFGGEKPILKDGDERYAKADAQGKGDTYAAYQDCYYLTVSAEKQPAVVDQRKEEIIDPGAFQSGDYGRAVLEISSYVSKNYGPQVSLKLLVVQKVRTGDRFGGGVSTEAAISALEEEPLDESEWGDEASWDDGDEDF